MSTTTRRSPLPPSHTRRSREHTTAIPANGEIVIRSHSLDFPGMFVYHWHILTHEDMAMMGVVKIVDGPAAPAVTPKVSA